MKHIVLTGFLVGLLEMGILAQDLGDVITVTDAPGAQQFPDVAYNSRDNTFLVVWEHVVDPQLYDIHGVLLNGETGQRIGDPVELIAGVEGFEAPEVAYNSTDNEFLLVARRRNGDLAFAQRISAIGQPVGDLVEIGRSGGPTFFDPAARARVVSVAYNATENQYFIGLGDPPSAQIVNADLSLEAIVEPFGIGTNPAAAWSSRSNVYLMAWEDREDRSSQNTGSENLSAQLISNTGELIGEAIRIRDQAFAEESPRIAYNHEDDHFLVIWDERIGFREGLNPPTLTDTMGQIINAEGQRIGDPIPIEAGTAYTLRQDTDYSAQHDMYLTVWKGDESGDFAFADVLGRFIRRDGSLASEIFVIADLGDDATNEGSDEHYFDESKLPVTAINSSGRFLVVWEEGGTNRNPDDRDIMARFVTPVITSLESWEVY